MPVRAFSRLVAGVALMMGVALATPAGAEPPACQGQDLWQERVEGLTIDRAAIEAAATKVLNGRATLWKVQPKAGGPVSHLLGTMHLTAPEITRLSDKKAAALEAARTVAFENTRVLDVSKLHETLGEIGPQMFMPDGGNYGNLLNPEQLDALRTALDRRGMPLLLVYGWKPTVLIFSLLAYPPCESERQKAGIRFLDATLYDWALAHGRVTADLETVEEQFAAMTDVPLPAQVDVLNAMLALDPHAEDSQATLAHFYRDSRIDLVWAFSNVVFKARSANDRSIDALWAQMLDRRNERMFERGKALVDAGPSLIAAGAAHMIGPSGLVQRFKDAGYLVTPVE